VNLIRAMMAADKPAMIKLLRASGACSAQEIAVAEDRIDLYLQDSGQTEYRVMIITHEAGGVAGHLCYGPTPLTKGTFSLYWIVVAPSQQKRGLGTQLLSWMEKKVEEEHGRVLIIVTSSQDKDEANRRFYLNLHYQECARIAGFYQPGIDRIIFMKYLEQTRSSKSNG